VRDISLLNKSLQRPPMLALQALYTVNQKKTWQFIFEYNFG